MPSTSEQVSSVTLEKIRLGAEAAFSHEALIMAPKVEWAQDWLIRTWRAQLTGFIWGKTIQRHQVRYPADWREAFKERWFPTWWKARWPVRYKEIDLNLQAIWPTLKLLVPNHEPRLVLTSFGSALGSYPACGGTIAEGHKILSASPKSTPSKPRRRRWSA